MTDHQHNKPGVSTSIDGDCPTFTQDGQLYEHDDEDGGPRITVWRYLSRTERALARQLSREATLAEREEARAEAKMQKAERTGVLASFEQLKASMSLECWRRHMERIVPWLNGGIEGLSLDIDQEALFRREEIRAKGEGRSEEGIEAALLRVEERQLLATASAMGDVDLDAEVEKILQALDASITAALKRKDEPSDP